MKPANLLILLIIIVSAFLFFRSAQKPTATQPPVTNPDIIIFWGEGCSHCENLKKYITENDIESKLKIVFKEVWKNESNLNELKETIKQCPEIDISKGFGVPTVFFTLEKKCTIGDIATIDKIKQMIK